MSAVPVFRSSSTTRLTSPALTGVPSSSTSSATLSDPSRGASSTIVNRISRRAPYSAGAYIAAGIAINPAIAPTASHPTFMPRISTAACSILESTLERCSSSILCRSHLLHFDALEAHRQAILLTSPTSEHPQSSGTIEARTQDVFPSRADWSSRPVRVGPKFRELHRPNVGEPSTGEDRGTSSRGTLANASLGRFTYVVKRDPALCGCLMRLPGSGGYYTSVSSSPEASLPSRSRKRILVARWVSGMDLVEIYIVRAETPEAVLASLHYVFAREADVVRALPHGEADLRGQYDVVAHALECPAGDLLGDTVRVDVGGVHEVTARLEKSADDLSGSLLVGLLSEGHAPQAQLGDHQPRVPKTCVIHALLLSNLHHRKAVL